MPHSLDHTTKIVNRYSLSPAQEGLLFHSLYAPGEGVYFEQRWCELKGDVNKPLFEKAWNLALSRHDVLRTCFSWQDTNEPCQQVMSEAFLQIKQLDWSDSPASEVINQLDVLLKEDRKKGFSLNQAPLMRCILIQVSEHGYVFVWSYHHLLMDGWCNGLLIAEVLKHYYQLCAGQEVVMEPAPRYGEFIAWLTKQDKSEAKTYWMKELANLPERIELPLTSGFDSFDYQEDKYSLRHFEGFSEQTVSLDSELSESIHKFAQEQRLTTNTLIQGMWALWLSMSGGDDVTFGVTLANRPPTLPGSAQMLGLFINTVPARVQIDPKEALTAWLQRLQQTQRQRETFGYIGLSEIQSWLTETQTTPLKVARGELFDSILVFENYPLSSTLALQQGSSTDIEHQLVIESPQGYERTHYPLALMVVPEPNSTGKGDLLNFCVRYDSERYSHQGITTLLDQLQVLLVNMLADTEQEISKISWLSESQTQQVLQWGAGKNKFIDPVTVSQKLEQQARLRPNDIALSFWGATKQVDYQQIECQKVEYLEDKVSYQDLNSRVNYLAQLLKEQGIGKGKAKGDRVGVCLKRTPALPVTLLALMRLGAAYVPLDPEYPQARLAYIAEQAETGMVIVEAATESVWLNPTHDPRGFKLFKLDSDIVNVSTAHNPLDSSLNSSQNSNVEVMPEAVSVGEDDLAYIMFTSGSTGKPKGVPITHRNLNNFLQSMSHTPGLGPKDRWLAVTTYAFDISVLELFLPIVSGAKLILGSSDLVRDPQLLKDCLQQEQITIMQASPSTWRLLQEINWQGNSSLKALCGGEALESDLADWLVSRCGSLWNMYGPTETTIWSAAQEVTSSLIAKAKKQHSKVFVGGAVDNTQLYVLDDNHKILPPGISGELYIAGDGLSAGYWQQADKTQAAFLPSCTLPGFPLSAVSSEKNTVLYRTGDRVCWQGDGLLKILGRTDHQIKLRGFRIEPGEIESVLNESAVVQLAAIRYVQEQLIAYIVPARNMSENSAISTDFLTELVKKHLPVYMIPNRWVFLDAMPLTPNGKLDRAALPDIDTISSNGSSNSSINGSNSSEQQYVGGVAKEKSQLQQLVAAVWQQVIVLEEEPELQDNFFNLGGHSLLATRVIGQLQKHFNHQLNDRNLSIRPLFENPVLADFCQHLANVLSENQLQPKIEMQIQPAGTATSTSVTPTPASWAQRRQWLLQQLDPNSHAYHIPVVLQLTPLVKQDKQSHRLRLDVDALKRSAEQLLRRHDSLRYGFIEQDNEPCLVTFDAESVIRSLYFKVSDLSKTSESEFQQTLGDTLDSIRFPFDLARPPLLRFHLLKKSDTEYVLVLNVHHIVVDDWSLGLLVQDLSQMYAKICADQTQDNLFVVNDHHEQRITYKDFAAWQRQQDYSEHAEFWNNELQGMPETLTLPYQRRPYKDTSVLSQENVATIKRLTIPLDSDLVTALNKQSGEQGSTLFMSLLAGFYILLARYTGQTDLVVATPVANRQLVQVQDLVGMFVNTLLLRVNLSQVATVAELLDQVRTKTLAALEHQEFPFEQLVDSLPQLRQKSGEPIQVLFSLQSAKLESFELADLQWRSLPVETRQAKCDINFSLRHTHQSKKQGIEGVLEYRCDRFDPLLMERFAGHYINILQQLVDQPQSEFRSWDILTDSEQCLLDSYCTGPITPTSGSVHRLFEQVAAAHPDTIAVRDQSVELSYAELNDRASQLAHLLISLEVEPETPVGIWSEKCWQSIVFMVAIFKAGGYFVPLDPKQPEKRLLKIAGNAQLSLVLVKTSVSEAQHQALFESCVELPYDLLAEELELQSRENATLMSSPEMLAYVMHTSGSTGVPKGVQTPHRGIVRTVKSANFVDFNQSTVMLQGAPLAFDASTLEIWGPLLNGGCVVVQPDNRQSFAELDALIQTNQINTAWFTAGLFNALIEEAPDTIARLDTVLAGGDVLSVSHLKELRRNAPGLKIINGYGPTETTTFACCHAITEGDLSAHSIPIGSAINNTRIYILDDSLQPVPLGVAGNLYVTGEGVARGYLHQPGMTAERFIANPFFKMTDLDNPAVSREMYNTGDLALVNDQGMVEFLGRKDTQVKIRGFRIDLREIEQTILQHRYVETASVDAVEINGQKRLVAWSTLSNTELAPDLACVKNQLTTELLLALPDYMQPNEWVFVDQWPITVNGKVDKQRLLECFHEQVSLSQSTKAGMDDADVMDVIEKSDDLQRTLYEIWRSLLPKVHLDHASNFFAIGGDSIIAMQIVARAQQIGLPLTAAMIFEWPTIAQLAEKIRSSLNEEKLAWIPAPAFPEGEIPLTPIQHWFFAQSLVQPQYYNQAMMFRVSQPIEKQSFEQLLHTVINRHDAFRIRFSKTPDGWAQYYSKGREALSIEWFELGQNSTGLSVDTGFSIDDAVSQLQSSLDLQKGPLWKVGCFQKQSHSEIVFIVHHLIVDGVSWRVIMGDLVRAWQQLSQGVSIAFGPKPYSFQQHAQQLSRSTVSQEIQEFWQQQNTEYQALKIPRDFSSTGDDNKQGNVGSIALSLSRDTTQLLLQTPDFNINEIAMGAVVKILTDWMGVKKLLIDVESHGRENGLDNTDFSLTMGWFTALYPLLLAGMNGSEPLDTHEYLEQIKQQLNLPADYKMGFGMMRYGCETALNNLQAEVVFNYLGLLDAGFADSESFSRLSVPGPLIHPDNQRKHLLEVNVWMETEQLTFEWRYSQSHHAFETITTLADNALLTLSHWGEVLIQEQTTHFVDHASVAEEDLFSALDQVSFD
ncbi:MAG: amino acid adenylation domain-containing protein [Pseudomonadales bacterium]|nr:amino acid adenylation domain-containing protein [Pseudomonadales bacterium]